MSLNIKTSTGRQVLASNGDVLIGGKNYEVYSENETVIGYWIDGKPIYQKVIIATTMPNKEVVIVPHGVLNIDKIIGVDGVFKQHTSVAANTWTPLPRVQDNQTNQDIAVDIDRTNIYLKARGFNMVGVFEKADIIIRYTKTTDTPVTDTNTYSAEEKITGETWVNGKPIYRQTIAITVPTATTQGIVEQNIYPLNVNVSEIISLQGMFKSADATSYNTFPRSYQDANNKIGTVILWYNLSNNTLVCENSALSANGRTGYAIIEYTKQ